MDSKAEKIALFRYGVIATLVLEKLPRGELVRRARELADREYDIPFSNRRRLCVDTLLHWAVRYRTGGLEALAPLVSGDPHDEIRESLQPASGLSEQHFNRLKLVGLPILRQRLADRDGPTAEFPVDGQSQGFLETSDSLRPGGD